MKSTAILVISLMISTAATTDLFAVNVPVAGDANIFGAGHASPPAPGGGGAGTLPPFVTFDAGRFSILTFTSVTGTVRLNTTGGGTGGNDNDPDGVGAGTASSNANSFGGLSGINAPNAGYLVGVFLTDAEPSDPAPSVLDFLSVGTSFATLSPVINQVFFIGDGLTGDGTGSQQQFIVPINATRLFLGISDAPSYHGDPGGYGDNIGSFTATFDIQSPVPEPSGIGLVLFGAGAFLVFRRRKSD